MSQPVTDTKKGAEVLPKAPLKDPKDAILDDLEIKKKPSKSSSNKNEMSSHKKFAKFKK